MFAQSIDAFDVPPVVGEETLTLHAGDILEIVPLTKIADPMATWVLTQNGTFVEASPARFRSGCECCGTERAWIDDTPGVVGPFESEWRAGTEFRR